MASAWLDFGAVRRRARFADILRYYGLKPVGAGEQRCILCPFHPEHTPSCSVHLGKGLFHCFGCGAEGTVIDFVAEMEGIDPRRAARQIAEICRIDAKGPRNEDLHQVGGDPKALPQPSTITPLDLDPEHPYLFQRGLTSDLIRLFGLGYCSRGPLRGRVCIPIHDARGELAAYAGRWASDAPPRGVPRYFFSPGFRKREVLFNLHRVSDPSTLVLVEGYWSVFRLHDLGIPVVGLMESSLSGEQIALLAERKSRLLTLLFDADRAGFCGRERALRMLCGSFYVRAPPLADGEKPDSISIPKLFQVLDER